MDTRAAAPRPAFPHEVRLAYDASYEPVVLGHTMFVPSMVTDSVTALDTDTGNERWRFFAEGPVRFAPVACEGKVYFVSDDGFLYCLDAKDGSLCWKFRGLPAGKRDRKVIGHGRLVSLWPARGGPVLAEGVVYFAAGLWPTEGVFIHAVDAESGEAVWSNTDSNHIPKSNWDHGQGQYAGMTPQGYLAIVGDRLVVPCGAQLPAFLDLETGRRHAYTMGWGGRNGLPKGCWFVAGVGNYLSHSGDLYDITRPNTERLPKTKPGDKDYKPMLYPGGWTRLDTERANQRELDSFRQPVLTPSVIYDSDLSIVARDLTEVALQEITAADLPAHRSEDPYPDTLGGKFRQLWELPSKLHVHIKAGSRLYVGGPGVVQAIDTVGDEPQVVWRAEIEGTPHRMLAADEKLFIVTAEGSILAFAAPQTGEATAHTSTASNVAPPADQWTAKTNAILKATGARDGYALVLGIDTGRLVEELARQSKLHVIAVDDDPEKVAAVRERLFAVGLYAARVSVLVGDPVTYPFSPYLASLVVSETPDDLGRAGDLALRKPFSTRYDPMAALPVPGARWPIAVGSRRSYRTKPRRLLVRACGRRATSCCWPARGHCRERRTGRMVRPTRPARGHQKTSLSVRPWPCCGSMLRSDGTSTRARTRFAWWGDAWCCSRKVCCERLTSSRAASCGRSTYRLAQSPLLRPSGMRDIDNGVPMRACRPQRNWW